MDLTEIFAFLVRVLETFCIWICAAVIVFGGLGLIGMAVSWFIARLFRQILGSWYASDSALTLSYTEYVCALERHDIQRVLIQHTGWDHYIRLTLLTQGGKKAHVVLPSGGLNLKKLLSQKVEIWVKDRPVGLDQLSQMGPTASLIILCFVGGLCSVSLGSCLFPLYRGDLALADWIKHKVTPWFVFRMGTWVFSLLLWVRWMRKRHWKAISYTQLDTALKAGAVRKAILLPGQADRPRRMQLGLQDGSTPYVIVPAGGLDWDRLQTTGVTLFQKQNTAWLQRLQTNGGLCLCVSMLCVAIGWLAWSKPCSYTDTGHAISFELDFREQLCFFCVLGGLPFFTLWHYTTDKSKRADPVISYTQFHLELAAGAWVKAILEQTLLGENRKIKLFRQDGAIAYVHFPLGGLNLEKMLAQGVEIFQKLQQSLPSDAPSPMSYTQFRQELSQGWIHTIKIMRTSSLSNKKKDWGAACTDDWAWVTRKEGTAASVVLPLGGLNLETALAQSILIFQTVPEHQGALYAFSPTALLKGIWITLVVSGAASMLVFLCCVAISGGVQDLAESDRLKSLLFFECLNG